MSRVKFILRNERGFLLLNVILLTLITSFAAVILINAVPRVRTPQSTLKLTAMYLANEQLAQLESLAAGGEQITDCDFLGLVEDLTTKNAGEGRPVIFTVKTDVTNVSGSDNLPTATVTVKWKVDEKDFELKAERTIRIVRKVTQQQTP